ncbi:hypothetical protein, partial [Xylella fastidiosa]|uniref:hypothetical protein n=1 Tax=Xylella fastidiosa TaxID=2371 RepID=UPI00287FFE33
MTTIPNRHPCPHTSKRTDEQQSITLFQTCTAYRTTCPTPRLRSETKIRYPNLPIPRKRYKLSTQGR